MSATVILPPPKRGPSYDLDYTDWARTYESALTRPYPSALYRNLRSGLEWQAYREDEGGFWCLRRERRLRGNFGWFRFSRTTSCALRDKRRWRYLGATPPEHYLYGYDMCSPVGYLTDGYQVAGGDEAVG